jgi:hypothetical protein
MLPYNRHPEQTEAEVEVVQQETKEVSPPTTPPPNNINHKETQPESESKPPDADKDGS